MSLTQQKLIHIKIEAFGAIERQLPADLNLQCESEIQVSEVLNQLLSLYPDIQPMLERCACAIGEDIISRQNVLNRDSTLVLLSPVAGG
ncbi:MoaD/ThiS family protein [Acinetobacter lwoffii]|uniref:MoaD/ThiS family protein n=1 Tax=Acinetobacter lwoffii TaxID=28090 RepID=A0AAW8AW22_ACILW|nr:MULTISPECIES: MoaD/ThiS family protein [Pseudomonadota]MCO8114303.1 MoaD/ThiS family protein [Acinetobacter lwoffii]MCU4421389.1 MoaD/ThiS family protein [Acinetobacter lwoffii]MCU4450454.1 MoaD/ThiS family protein [Acinetobacter lwoffii]MDP1369962.1 MoaD/ThiS family protein [Acinetobacter lwoffii]MDP1390911.1 MoaD/ThiS family protein [Acinetobacter lwoffii]